MSDNERCRKFTIPPKYSNSPPSIDTSDEELEKIGAQIANERKARQAHLVKTSELIKALGEDWEQIALRIKSERVGIFGDHYQASLNVDLEEPVTRIGPLMEGYKYVKNFRTHTTSVIDFENNKRGLSLSLVNINIRQEAEGVFPPNLYPCLVFKFKENMPSEIEIDWGPMYGFTAQLLEGNAGYSPLLYFSMVGDSKIKIVFDKNRSPVIKAMA